MLNAVQPVDRPRTPDGEQGSVVMAMLVLLILAGLTAAVMAYSQSALRNTAYRTLQDEALGGVDVAMAEATARVELGESASFTGAGTLDNVRYQYTATKETTSRWTVYADATATRGTTSAATAVTATVVGANGGRDPYALFVVDSMDLNSDNVAISEPIGTNGKVKVKKSTADHLIHLYEPNASCDGCNRTETRSPTYPIVQPATPSPSRSCPLATLTQSDGTRSTVYGFLGTVDGRSGVPYRCTFDDRNDPLGHRPAIIYQTITIKNPPLIIHVDQDVTVWFLRANVNPGGKAGDFIVQAVGGPSKRGKYEYGQLWDDGLGMVGVLDAPMRSLDVNSVDLRGRMTIGNLDVKKGTFSVIADPSVVDSTVTWTIQDWQRVAVR